MASEERQNIISVIVATYNEEDTIGRTLDHILSQKCRLPIEIVVGEDHSTDNTLAVCKDYQSRYPDQIVLLANRENKGVVRNYYDCIRASHGKYLADCAGDDYWPDDNKLEKELEVLESHPEVTMVYTNFVYDNGLQRVEARPGEKASIIDGKQLLLPIITQIDYPVINTGTSFYRFETLKADYDSTPELYDADDLGCEDLQLCCAMAAAGSIAYLPDITMSYTVSETSITGNQNEPRQFRYKLQTTLTSLKLARKYGIDFSVLKPFLQRKTFALMMHAFRSHKTELRDEALRFQRQWKVANTLNIFIVKLVMSNALLWRLSLSLRRLVVRLKHSHA